ncbi:hypothetical protein FXO37_20684 [Capsicum annuum]|nr:hypothetical protein FXO37_20684 [Capsicum annuum]
MLLSVVAPVTASVQTELTLGFRKPSVNVDGAGNGSIANVAPSSSMSFFPMAQAVFAGKQPSAIGKRCREKEQSDDGSSKKKRAYYKCTIFPKCPAKKHVEKAMDDPIMLIVTYDEEYYDKQVAVQEYDSQMMALRADNITSGRAKGVSRAFMVRDARRSQDLGSGRDRMLQQFRLVAEQINKYAGQIASQCVHRRHEGSTESFFMLANLANGSE